MLSNSSANAMLPSLPAYTLESLPPLIPGVEDKYLTLALPILAYWILSLIFHYIDERDLFPQYRLHTPAEVLKRNHVSQYEVIRDVVIQQVLQTFFGLGLAYLEPEPLMGKDAFNVANWAQRLRLLQQALPRVLSLVGIDSLRLSEKVATSLPTFASALAGGHYPSLFTMTTGGSSSAFAPWEILVARWIYWIGIPAGQFLFAILIVDTWQYFLHRAMHMNKWLYTTFHSRHHRLYVPYAFGALYNHPFEGFLLDTCGTGLAYLLAGMTPRQSMWFFTCSTIKTVDDHCGYALPFDPLQHITSNNAGYHDVHHQSWGIKTNFSQPFFTFWDRALGTVWSGGDVSARYERAKKAAAQKVSADKAGSITGSLPIDSNVQLSSAAPYDDATQSTIQSQAAAKPAVPSGHASRQAAASREQIRQDESVSGGQIVINEETAEEEKEMRWRAKSTSSASIQAGSLKGLRDRVSSTGGSFHGRKGSLLGYDGGR